LGLAEHEGVFCYVNSVFAPGLDEGVGNLWRVSFGLFSFYFCLGCFADFRFSASKPERSWLLVIVLRRLLGEGGMIGRELVRQGQVA
jgi:hypothetical protein